MAGRSRTQLGISLTAALAAGLAALLLLAQLAGHREPQPTEARDFLAKTLGSPQAAASLVRKPAPNVRLHVGRSVRFERDGAAVGVALAGASGTWQPHLRGASRPAPFGREAVVFRGEYGLEQYLRVEERQGKRTWRWTLDAPGLTPTIAADGGVDFARGTRSAGIRIQPAAIFDRAGGTSRPRTRVGRSSAPGAPGRSRSSSTTPTSRSRT